jgi:hypothetical protein
MTTKFSIGHPEQGQENYPYVMYELFKNTPPETLADFEDLYFGKFFYYEYDGVPKRYGNCMGVEATDEAVDYLFKIQDEFGVPISLTMNSLEIPGELQMDMRLQDAFIDWIGQYYERGLRSITLANTHLVRTGKIQKRFPDLRIKNTVNHIVSDAQQVVDYAYLGYHTILLDRSLNRNFQELKKIKKAVDRLNAKKQDKSMPLKTSLLVAESCLYKCPFKKEHDDIGATISGDYFNSMSALTCDGWRNPQFANLPRNGVDLYATYTETFNELAKLVDIFKFSGRLTSYRLDLNMIREQKARYLWLFNGADNITKQKFSNTIMHDETALFAKKFQDILDNNAAPIHMWVPSYGYGAVENFYITEERYQELYEKYMKDDVWFSPEGRELEKILQGCKSQCWDCHKCEDVYGVGHVDSALQFRTAGY